MKKRRLQLYGHLHWMKYNEINTQIFNLINKLMQMQTITVRINRRRQNNARNGREKKNYKQLFWQVIQKAGGIDSGRRADIRTTAPAELSMFAGEECMIHNRMLIYRTSTNGLFDNNNNISLPSTVYTFFLPGSSFVLLISYLFDKVVGPLQLFVFKSNIGILK